MRLAPFLKSGMATMTFAVIDDLQLTRFKGRFQPIFNLPAQRLDLCA